MVANNNGFIRTVGHTTVGNGCNLLFGKIGLGLEMADLLRGSLFRSRSTKHPCTRTLGSPDIRRGRISGGGDYLDRGPIHRAGFSICMAGASGLGYRGTPLEEHRPKGTRG